MKKKTQIQIGDTVLRRKDGVQCRICKFGESVGMFRAMVLETNEMVDLKIKEIASDLAKRPKCVGVPDLDDLDEAEVARLEKEREVIEAFDAKPRRTRADAVQGAQELGLSVRHFYRLWRRLTGNLRSLIRGQSDGGRGSSRLSEKHQKILDASMRLYVKPDAATRDKVIEAVWKACKAADIPLISESTIRRRMRKKPQKDLAIGKYGRIEGENMFGPAAGQYKEAVAPLRVVQIDHTPLDLSLVDRESGNIIGQAWLTIAIDVFSRMVVAIYLSFEDPNTNSVALTIYRAVVPKDDYLKRLGIKAEWPVWGMMQMIHADNGPDFRTKELTLACKEHRIDIQWRPSKNPRYGAHIERLAKRVNEEVQRLNGRIPADFKQRKHENPERTATFALREAEKYLVTWITKVYHQEFHSGIGTSPIEKFKEGLYGDRAIGVPYPPENPKQLLLDLTPWEERTVQRGGIEIDNMRYFHPLLSSFIHARDPKHPRLARKFRCRTPIDDALVIYFQNPDTKEYFRIDCADRNMPPMTRHELRLVLKHLNKKGSGKIDMNAIKQGRKELIRLEDQVLAKQAQSPAARSVRRKRAITTSLQQTGSPLPHKVAAQPSLPTQLKDYDLADIPIFEVDK